MKSGKVKYIWGLLRLGMGWIFFWSFIDKVFGLGFATPEGKGWIDGSSPTSGFLTFAAKGPFAEFYQGLAGSQLIDWLFMLGLLCIGVFLLLGILVKLAGYFGAIMLILMYTAGFILPEHNPFLDDHIIYAVVMVGLTMSGAGRYLGFGKRWSKLKFVRMHPILE